jgi:hypothetical protein
MKSPVSRDDIKTSFAPLVPLLEEAVKEARAASSYDAIVKANPEVLRTAHLRRLAGSKRWMIVADGLAARAPRMPEGFGMESTDADHNQGKYAIRFPLGVCTVRREPHEGDEGKYLQEHIEGVLDQAPLADDVDAFAGVKVYVSVPPDGPVKLIATHPTFPEPMVILLDEISVASDGAVEAIQPTAPTPAAVVTSTLTEDADDEDADEDNQAP